jgi:hypothetical protein
VVYILYIVVWYNRVTKKTQHQNPEFGHKWMKFKNKLAYKYISIQERRGELRKPSILVVNYVSLNR